MTWSRCVVALLTAIVFAGCAVKSPPPHSELQQQSLPNLHMPETWASKGTATGAVQEGWLATFNDPQLNDIVQEALAYNADLQVASARVEQAGGYVKVAGAKLYPTVDLLARGGGKMGGDSTGLQGVGVFVGWELDVWGRVRAGRAASQDQYASTAADYEYARQSLAALVAKGWFTASEAKQQKALAQETVRAAEQLLSIARDRERVGRGDATDVAIAQANVETFRDTLRQLDLAYEQAERALESLLGRYPSAVLNAPDALPAMPGPVPAGLPSELMERRPDVIASERRVAAAFHRIQEAQAARLPRISLTADVTTLSSELFVLQQRDNPVWSAGASLVQPLFQGGALKAQVEIRTAEQKQAVADYARVGLRAFGEVENALSSGLALEEREQILARAVAENARAAELTRIRYEVGSTDLRPVLQQRLVLYASRSALLRVQSEQRVQRVNLHLALGGGFGGTFLHDQTSVKTDGEASVVDVYRVVGTGGTEIRAPAHGWPQAVQVRLHGFGELESLRAESVDTSMACTPSQSFIHGLEYECKVGGKSVGQLATRDDYLELRLPASMLTADTTRVEVRWAERPMRVGARQ